MLLSILEVEKISKELAHPQTKAIIFESPTNPQLRTIDVDWLCDVAKQHDVLTLCDHTALGPRAFAESKIDIFIQSLTKYASGHGDVMGGAICGAKAILEPIRKNAEFVGNILDPHSAFLIERGLRTFDLRFAKSSASAEIVGKWMQKSTFFTEVRFAGGLIYACLREGEEGIGKLVDGLKLFACVASFGSCESLIATVYDYFGDGFSFEERAKAGLYPGAFRLSIGLEDPQDLIQDLQNALKK